MVAVVMEYFVGSYVLLSHVLREWAKFFGWVMMKLMQFTREVNCSIRKRCVVP